MNKVLIYNKKSISKSTTWLLFLLFGWSYGSMGKIGLQLLYWFTGGGFGLWMLYRLFTLNKAIKKYNLDIAIGLGMSEEELKILDLM